jgi:hypothetical protein
MGILLKHGENSSSSRKERKKENCMVHITKAYTQQNSFNPDPETPEILILWQTRKASPDSGCCDTSEPLGAYCHIVFSCETK